MLIQIILLYVFSDDMTSLIQTCGGAVVSDVDSLRTTDRTPLIVTCSDVEDEDGDVQVSSQDIAMFNSKYMYIEKATCIGKG